MKIKWQPKQIKLNKKGLAKILGEREAQVMDVVWEKEEVSVRDVCSELCKKREFSFNTIMTIMNRLTVKGLLAKRDKEGVFCYKAILDKKNFMMRSASDILSSIFQDKELFSEKILEEALKNSHKSKKKALKKS